jgi:GAF domain-containing protein
MEGQAMSEHLATEGTGGRENAHVALARIQIADQPLGAVLQQIAGLARDALPGTDEASVTLMKNGKARTVAFTGPLAVDLDERQYGSGSGPCLDAAVYGERVILANLAEETTYKEFAAAATRNGVVHTMSMGLPVGSTTVGALNFYGRHGEPLDGSALELAETFAAYAAVAVRNAAALADAVEEAEGLRTAMATRAGIEQAKGILMRDQRVGPDEAFRMLVQASNNSNRKLRDVAAAIVESAQR